MPKTIKATLSNGTGTPIDVEFELQDAEMEAIQQFIDAANQLFNCSFAKTLHEGFRLHGDESGLRFELPKVEPEAMAAFLLYYRPVVLEDERCSFERVRRILGRHYRDTPVAGVLKDWHKRFKGHATHVPITFEVGSQRIDDANALSLWLNSHHYHRDVTKRAQLDALRAGIPEPVFDAAIRKTLLEQLQAVARLAELSTALLHGNRGDTVQIG